MQLGYCHLVGTITDSLPPTGNSSCSEDWNSLRVDVAASFRFSVSLACECEAMNVQVTSTTCICSIL